MASTVRKQREINAVVYLTLFFLGSPEVHPIRCGCSQLSSLPTSITLIQIISHRHGQWLTLLIPYKYAQQLISYLTLDTSKLTMLTIAAAILKNWVWFSLMGYRDYEKKEREDWNLKHRCCIGCNDKKGSFEWLLYLWFEESHLLQKYTPVYRASFQDKTDGEVQSWGHGFWGDFTTFRWHVLMN